MTPEEVRQLIRDELSTFLKADRYIFDKNIQILDARKIQVGKSTGLKIGTEATQKIGFYGVTPVVQASVISAPSGSGTAGVDSSARTAIVSLIAAVKNFGITQ